MMSRDKFAIINEITRLKTRNECLEERILELQEQNEKQQEHYEEQQERSQERYEEFQKYHEKLIRNNQERYDYLQRQYNFLVFFLCLVVMLVFTAGFLFYKNYEKAWLYIDKTNVSILLRKSF
jgi:CRISPR/Cas system CMR subunit Cmr6 (Cas7 group RAMP superfamily)